ncbi:dapper homolog 3-like [Rhinatrema bivittatum]|uniref:dapper homolog 3-like n=1 Tax=Rhinatrema bivittatum TaxID=194408 RepID=UPI0011285D6D|nr:dapper homolog 3-like [Rhinatrema bivittatum]
MSVCSSCPGGSRWSMNSLSQLPLVRESGFPRPRSTDEAAVRLQDPGVPGLFGASGAQCLAGHIYGQRPGSRRPVSTGDLEFLPPAPHLTELSAPSQQERSPQLQLYACDLVSHATSDVYRYPSPLHAVALQSPLFASLPQEELPDGQDSAAPGNRPTLPSQSCFSPELHRCRVERYISKLVLRHRCRSALTRSELTLLAGQQKSLSLTSVCSGQPLGSPPGLSLPPRPASTGWKVRRRISTCSHLRPLDSPEDPRDSRAPRCYSVNSQESGSVGSSTTDVSKVSDLSLGSLLEDLTLFREPAASPAPKPDRCRSLREPAGPEHGVFSGKWSSLKCGRETGKLYRGKHASQELVRAPESRPGPEHSWLSPRELLRRISTRRKPAPRGNGCCRSEVDVNAVAARRAGGCGSPPWEERGPPRQKWASVQEICSSSAPALPRKRAQRGPARLLSRHLSTDSPLHFCQQHGRVRLWEQAAGPGLGEVDATSSCSLAGDWIQQAVWMKGMAPATLDAGNVAGASFKLHRTRSLKELRRMVCRSMKPFSLGGQASSR